MLSQPECFVIRRRGRRACICDNLDRYYVTLSLDDPHNRLRVVIWGRLKQMDIKGRSCAKIELQVGFAALSSPDEVDAMTELTKHKICVSVKS
jgi:hypothetical protein